MNLSKRLFALFCITACVVQTTSAPPRNVVENEIPIQRDQLVQEENSLENAVPVLKHENGVNNEVPVQEVLRVPPKNEELPKVEKDMKFEMPKVGEPISVDKLKPPDHLDAVKLEQDGMLNKDYKKEIFLGNHEEIDDDNRDVAESKLKDIFHKVDANKDGKLSDYEIEGWILEKTKEHFDEALEENAHVFKHLDPDGDGVVDWKEYYVHFLLAKGYNIEQATKHVVDYDEIELDYEAREALIRYKFKWTDADVNPMDNKLTEKEFLAFRHPEQSEQALGNMLRTIMESLDKNDDGELSEEEFVALPLGEVDDEEQKKLDKEWQAERQHEFRKQIDRDNNGRVSQEELKKYLDPRNPEQAKTDCKNLIDLIDDNKDGLLSWEEIMRHKEVFIDSKVVNVKRLLHDEF